MQKIVPFLWFNDNAEEAVRFYASIFKNSKIGGISRGPNNAFMSANFYLEGQEFIALNGGPEFKFTEAVSFFVNCETQEEIDFFWSKLTSEGGQEQPCGWAKDRFGLSWQIIPPILMKLLTDNDPSKAQRVMQAMLKMKKIEIAKLKQAYEGKG